MVFDPSKKKKRKPKKPTIKLDDIELDDDKAVESPTGGDSADAKETKEDGEADYTYEELFNRVYQNINSDRGIDAGKGSKKSIEPPEVLKVAARKVLWSNFVSNCKSINRPIEHVLEFVLTELGTEGSLTSENKLTIKGRFQSKNLENVLRKYIIEYVTCGTCKSPNTDLKKENRITFKLCRDCGAQSSVAPIKTGFRAQTRRRQ